MRSEAVEKALCWMFNRNPPGALSRTRYMWKRRHPRPSTYGQGLLVCFPLVRDKLKSPKQQAVLVPMMSSALKLQTSEANVLGGVVGSFRFDFFS